MTLKMAGQSVSKVKEKYNEGTDSKAATQGHDCSVKETTGKCGQHSDKVDEPRTPPNPPPRDSIIEILLELFDLITMRSLLNISRNKVILILGSVCFALFTIRTVNDLSSRFEEMHRTISSLRSDVSLYKRQAYYQEQTSKTKLQHRLAQDILEGLGPAIVKPNVNKDKNDSTNINEDNPSSQPRTPGGSVYGFTQSQGQFVNPHDFRYIINNENMCAGQDYISYIVYVHTSPNHFKSRMALRNTWAQPNLLVGHPSRLVFFLGTTDPETQAGIEEEAQQYRDIVQEDYIDDYHNLTYKGIGALKWISTYCNQTKYVFKADDDTFVNTFMLMDMLQTDYLDLSRFVMCMHWGHMPILRMNSNKSCHKWCMSERVFPGKKHYPRYCSGAAYFLSGDIIPEMYSSSLKIPFFWVDDVYITGLLTQRIKGLKWIQQGKRYKYNVQEFKDNYRHANETTWMVSLTKTYQTLLELWIILLQRLTPRQVESIGKEKFVYLEQMAIKTFKGEANSTSMK